MEDLKEQNKLFWLKKLKLLKSYYLNCMLKFQVKDLTTKNGLIIKPFAG